MQWKSLRLAGMWAMLAASAPACDWPSKSPPERLERSAFAFLGRVVAKDAPSRLGEPVTFTVEEAFKGTRRGATILISPGEGDCRSVFKAGGNYVVFGFQSRAGALPEASKASGSAPVSEAAAVVRWLRRRRDPNWNARILGAVWAGDAAPGGAARKPLSGATITVSGEGGTFTAPSDAEGVYELSGLPPGDYDLRASSQGRRTYGEYLRVKAGACCVFQDVTLWLDGHLGGVVQTDRGAPVAGLRIELAYLWPEAPSVRVLFRDAITGAGGRFQFTGIPPGRYLVGFGLLASPTPRQPYPQTFKTLSLAPNQRIDDLKIEAQQPLAPRRVLIRVLMPDGRMAPGARVFVGDDPGHTAPIEFRADEFGTARVEWVQDAAFRIHSESQDSERRLLMSGWKRIGPGKAAIELTLKLGRPND